MSYGWLITNDHIAEPGAPEQTNANARGLTGPRSITPETEARLRQGEGRMFRMRDDDRELYYEGRYLGPEQDGDLSETAFGPLEDFGTPNAGCSYIEYQGPRGWEVL